MLKISKGCQYALHLLSNIPVNSIGQKFLAVDLCRKAKVPVHSSRKILQQLVQQGFFEAVPGPGGGYRLLKDPNEVSLLDIIRLIDGKDAFDHCVMGLPQCNSINPCPAHNCWMKVKEEMKMEMDSKSLLHLMNADKKKKR